MFNTLKNMYNFETKIQGYCMRGHTLNTNIGFNYNKAYKSAYVQIQIEARSTQICIFNELALFESFLFVSVFVFNRFCVFKLLVCNYMRPSFSEASASYP